MLQVGLGDNRTFLHDVAAIDRRQTDKGIGWPLGTLPSGSQVAVQQT